MRKLRNNKNIFFMFLLLLCAQFSQAQREHPVTIIIAPDHPDWIYKVNETVTFNIQIIKHISEVIRQNKKIIFRYKACFLF